MQVKAVTNKEFVLTYNNLNNKVACRTAVYTAIALVTQSDTLTVVDTCGYVHLQGLVLTNSAVATAFVQ